MPSFSNKLGTGWLRLLRPPNLLTVPGDPVAGFLLATLAGSGRSFFYILPAAGASLMLYVAGLIGNDYFDFSEDSIVRPQRPLPSGVVAPRAALFASVFCALTGVALACAIDSATCVAAVALASLVLFYNAFTKHVPFIGALNMGACRGLSLLLGATAAGWRPPGTNAVIVACLGLTLYVTAVTSLAGRETEMTRMPVRRWFPCAVSIALVGGLLLAGAKWNVLFLVIAIPAVAWPCFLGIRLGPAPEPPQLQAAIGAFLRGLLLLQAVLASLLLPAGVFAAMLILLAWPVNAYLAKRFYAS